MNWPKITGYVGATVIAISVLAQFCARIIPEPQTDAVVEDVTRWARYIGAYATIVIGIYLARVFNKHLYILISIPIAILSFVPLLGFYADLVFLFWAFAKLDQKEGGLPF